MSEPEPSIASMVVLPRVDGDKAPSRVWGKARCQIPTCRAWLWLGAETFRLVSSRQAYPVCQPCAKQALGEHGGFLEGSVEDE